MSEATVNLKLTPADFDLVRAALGAYAEYHKAKSREDALTGRERAESHSTAVVADGLWHKLGGK